MVGPESTRGLNPEMRPRALDSSAALGQEQFLGKKDWSSTPEAAQNPEPPGISTSPTYTLALEHLLS